MGENQLSMVSLGSGSKGNAYYMWNNTHGVLIDCGVSTKQILARLESIGLAYPRIDAVFVTHEHTDHISSCAILERTLEKQNQYPKFYMSPGTFHAAPVNSIPRNLYFIQDEEEVMVGDLCIDAFEVPHDGIGTMGFRVGFDDHWAGVITDLGHVNDVVLDKMRSLSMMAFEFNHDVDMLLCGDYPDYLKERILSDYGHLSNIQAANALEEAVSPRLQHLILAHISEKNNDPKLAETIARTSLENVRHTDIVSLHVAEQDRPSPVFTVNRSPRMCLPTRWIG